MWMDYEQVAQVVSYENVCNNVDKEVEAQDECFDEDGTKTQRSWVWTKIHGISREKFTSMN
jgi:hypothetical protein